MTLKNISLVALGAITCLVVLHMAGSLTGTAAVIGLWCMRISIVVAVFTVICDIMLRIMWRDKQECENLPCVLMV